MKDKSIIEKLGLEKWGWWPNCCNFEGGAITSNKYGGHIALPVGDKNKPYVKNNARLIAAAPQLLESLIEITIEDDENFLPGTPLRAGIDDRIALIESATGKIWEGIKEL